MNQAVIESAQSQATLRSPAGAQSNEIFPPARTPISIGDVAIELNVNESGRTFLSHPLADFRAEIASSDIRLDVRWTPRLRTRRNPDFDSHAVWTLFREEAASVFDFTSKVLSFDPYKRLHVSDDFRAGELLLNSEALEPYTPICPLEYPADELLITNYLACHGLGVEVHGLGLIDGETGGHLFLGHSGAGKSTTARLWQSFRNPEVLSDDRIILRLRGGELWMYGTPWHGEAALASPGKAKLNRIFILQHGRENQIIALPKARAAGELFARCFPPFHSAAGLDRTIEFLNRVVETVPCHNFFFVPEASAISTTLAFHD